MINLRIFVIGGPVVFRQGSGYLATSGYHVAHMTDIKVKDFIFGMPTRFAGEKAAGLDATIQFLISGEDGGNFVLHINDGTCTANEGLEASPTLTLRMSSETYIGMAIGKLKGPQAFFMRKLRFEGEIKLLMKMHSLFPSVSESDLH